MSPVLANAEELGATRVHHSDAIVLGPGPVAHVRIHVLEDLGIYTPIQDHSGRWMARRRRNVREGAACAILLISENSQSAEVCSACCGLGSGSRSPLMRSAADFRQALRAYAKSCSSSANLGACVVSRRTAIWTTLGLSDSAYAVDHFSESHLRTVRLPDLRPPKKRQKPLAKAFFTIRSHRARWLDAEVCAREEVCF